MNTDDLDERSPPAPADPDASAGADPGKTESASDPTADEPNGESSDGQESHGPRLELELDNERNDRILGWMVVGFAVLLATFKIADSDIWWHLRSGAVINELRAVPTEDTLSVTAKGKPWINMTWLFDLGAYHIYNATQAYGLIAAKAVLVGLTALCLLQLRASGPTLWWTCVCAAAALLPMSLRFRVRPELITMLLLAVQLVILHRHRREGGSKLIWTLPLVQVLWVNLHGLFALGVVLPGLYLLGELVDRSWHKAEPTGRVRNLAIALGLTVCACLASPFTWRGALFPFELLTRVTSPDYTTQISELQPLYKASPIDNPNLWVFYGIVAAAVLTFALNHRRIRLSRVLVFIGFMGIGLLAYRNIALATLVAAAVASLNGSEWWVDRFGPEPRQSLGWVLYGQIGRGLTWLILLGAAFLGVSGRLVLGSWGYEWFGLGLEPNRSVARSAEFLRDSGLSGNGFVMNLEFANQLLWYNWPAKAFMDGRLEVYDAHLRLYEDMRKAVRDNLVSDGDVKVKRPDGTTETARRLGWKSVFDKHDVSYVVLPMNRPPRKPMYITFRNLYQARKHWALVYLDAVTAIFARTDVAKNRQAVARRRIDLDRANYAAADPPVANHEEARARTFWDRLWRTRWPEPAGLLLARHYQVLGAPAPVGLGLSLDFLIIRALRRGLAEDPSCAECYSSLAERYAVLAGNESQTDPRQQTRALDVMRTRQVLYCLNQALACRPDSDVLRGRIRLNLARFYGTIGCIDLAQEHFMTLRGSPVLSKVLPDEQQREGLRETTSNLKMRVSELQQALQPLRDQTTNVRFLVGPYRARGLVGETIRMLERAREVAINFDMGMARELVDLYLTVGRGGDARDLLLRIARNTPPRQASALKLDVRFALVHLLLGDCEQAHDRYAGLCLTVAMETVRQYGVAMDGLLRGGIYDAIAVPTQMTGSLDTLTDYHYRMGLISLEQGRPTKAIEAFRKVLEINPKYGRRRTVETYLKHLGPPGPTTAPSSVRGSITDSKRLPTTTPSGKSP